MSKIFLFSSLLLVTSYIPLNGQTIKMGPIASENKIEFSKGPSYADEYIDIENYLSGIGYSIADYEYLLIYPWNKQLYTDNHWESMFTTDYHFRDILVIYVFDIYFQRYEKRLKVNRKKYIAIDKNNRFADQAFYSYSPILYKISDKKIIEKYFLGWTYGYQKKADLFYQLKANP
ncbi:MAG: hypothetical protein ACQETL_00825 [Bacteroidota bacterium]